MMDKKEHIGFELAKKFYENGCEVKVQLESVRKYWIFWQNFHNKVLLPERDASFYEDKYPAYHYYDILVTYADEFFEKMEPTPPKGAMVSRSINPDFYGIRYHILDAVTERNYKYADELIWQYCKFNPKNRGE